MPLHRPCLPLILRCLILLCALLLSAPAPGLAQSLPIPGATEGEEAPSDPLGRLTPRSTVDGLFDAFAEGDAETVRPYLDLSEIEEGRRNIEGRRLAQRLQTVLDREALIVPGFRLSSEPAGDIGDGLPPDQEVFAEVDLDTDPKPLTLLRGPSEDGTQIWRVSPAALALIDEIEIGDAAATYAGYVPEGLRGYDIAGAPAAAWIAALVAGALAVVITAAIVWLLYGALAFLVRPMRDGATGRLLRPMRLPIALVLAAPLALAFSVIWGIPVVVRATLGPVVETLVWLAITWMVLRLVMAIGQELIDAMTKKQRLGAVSVIALGRRAAAALVIVVAAALIASSFGLNLAGWFAALGIGGIAIALGAQKTIEHMVGGVSIIADQPIRVGDFFQADGLMGTVEDIGLRSTRVRTLDRSLVTVPNGDLSSTRIDNLSTRDRFLWHTTIGLRYETTPDQMRTILRQLEILLLSEDRIAEDPRARFIGFGASSLDIEIFAYILAKEYPASLAIREELNLAVMDIVAEGGSAFAFPSRTIYMAEDTPIEAPAGDASSA